MSLFYARRAVSHQLYSDLATTMDSKTRRPQGGGQEVDLEARRCQEAPWRRPSPCFGGLLAARGYTEDAVPKAKRNRSKRIKRFHGVKFGSIRKRKRF